MPGAQLMTRFAAVLLVIVLAACSSSALNLASKSATTPYRGMAGQPAADPGVADYGVTPDPNMPIAIAAPKLDPNHSYSLPELINIAQLANPATQAAWQRAREAAAATGIAEASYLPIITADVLAGYAVTSIQRPGSMGCSSLSRMARSPHLAHRRCHRWRSNGCCSISVRGTRRWQAPNSSPLPPMSGSTRRIKN